MCARISSADANCRDGVPRLAEQTLMLEPGVDERVPPILHPAFLQLLRLSALSDPEYLQY